MGPPCQEMVTSKRPDSNGSQTSGIWPCRSSISERDARVVRLKRVSACMACPFWHFARKRGTRLNPNLLSGPVEDPLPKWCLIILLKNELFVSQMKLLKQTRLLLDRHLEQLAARSDDAAGEHLHRHRDVLWKTTGVGPGRVFFFFFFQKVPKYGGQGVWSGFGRSTRIDGLPYFKSGSTKIGTPPS